MDALTIRYANAMPAPTWSWLRMNDTKIEVPAGLERAAATSLEASDALMDHTMSFEGALAGLQARLDKASAGSEGAADGRAVARAAQRAQEDVSDLDTPALSAYQLRAAREELANDVAASFEGGIGADARAYLNFLAGGTVTLATKEGAEDAATVRVTGEAGCAAASSVDVIAAPGSTLDLTIALDGVSDAIGNPGLVGSTLRVFAGAGARVDVTVYLTADAPYTVLDDSGFVLDDRARVSVRHVVLGAGHSVTGLASDVRGDQARIDIDTRYLAAASEVRDFNYVIRQRGRKTISNMNANGVLAGSARKVLRGTIDLVHGCKGSVGSEQETVLLASEGVDNKTVPVILCDEDDVAGNHGATIGHVRADQRFYLMSRGISPEAAEALFARAKLEDAALNAPDELCRDAVVRLGDALVPGFAEDLADTLEEDAR